MYKRQNSDLHKNRISFLGKEKGGKSDLEPAEFPQPREQK